MCFRITLLLIFMIHSSGLFAQEIDSLMEAKPQSFIPSEVPSKLVELDQLLEEVKELGIPDPDYLEIADSLIALEDSVNMVIEQVDSVPSGIGMQFMELHKNRILELSKPLSEWIETINQKVGAIESAMDNINSVRKSWEITISDSAKLELSESLNSQIQQRLDSLDHYQQVMLTHANQVLLTEVKLSQLDQKLLETVNNLNTYMDSHLWARDSPPLWNKGQDINQGSWWSQFKGISSSNLQTLTAYFNNSRTYFYWHLGLLLVMLYLFFWINHSSKSHPEYQDLEALYHALTKPVLSALLVTMVFSAAFYTNDPEVLSYTFILITLIPLIGIFYEFVHPAFKLPLIGLLGLYLLNYIQVLLPVGSGIHRTVLACEALAAITYTWWVIQLFKKQRVEIPYGWLRILIRLLPLALVLVAISLTANIIGSVRLSKIILSGVVGSGAKAVILYGAVLVLSGLVAYLLRTPHANLFLLIKENFQLMEKRLNQLFQLAAFIIWIRSTLISFGFLDRFVLWFRDFWASGLTFGNLQVTVGGILGSLMILISGWWIAKMLRLLLERELYQRLKISKGIPYAISTVLYYFTIVFGFLLAASYAGFDLNQISLIIGALGVGIGFGLQEVISNFVSGLILTFERPINVGDTIEVGDLVGVVTGIGIRSSHLKTFDGSEVIVPNSNLISNEVINWTLSDNKRRMTMPIVTALGNDVNQVIELINGVMEDHPLVLETPQPETFFEGFEDNSMEFKVQFWVNFMESQKAKSALASQIFDTLKESDIEASLQEEG